MAQLVLIVLPTTQQNAILVIRDSTHLAIYAFKNSALAQTEMALPKPFAQLITLKNANHVPTDSTYSANHVF